MAAHNDQEESSVPSMRRKALEAGKHYAKEMVKKVLKEIAKKLIKMLAKLIMKLIAKLIAVVLFYIGIPALIVILLIIIVGGCIIYVSISFGWLSNDDSGDMAQKLKSQYESAIVKTSDLPEYRPPMLVVQAIDNIRITRNNLENTDIDPKPIASALKPDLTYKKFTNTTVTITETTEEKQILDEDGEPLYDENGKLKVETTTNRSESKDEESVNLLVTAHAWNRIENISYHEETSTTSSGNTTVIKTFWVRDEQACTMPSTSTGSANSGTVEGQPSGKSHPLFILYGPAATEEEKKSGVPAAVTLAQLVQESGWQPSELASKYYNFFGIKAQNGDGWTGPVVQYQTKEQDRFGNESIINANFRVYANATEGFHGHSQFLLDNGRYKPILSLKNPYAFANGLQVAGYATDVNYAYNLRSLIHEYNLTQYDLDKGTDPATGQPYEDVGYSGPIGDITGGLFSGCGTPDFSKFDLILMKLDFGTDDASMAMLSINENDPSHSLIGRYNGFFIDAFQILNASGSYGDGSSSGSIADAPVIPGSTTWIFPTLTKAILGSPYGWRYDNTKGKEALHKGQDISRTPDDRSNNLSYPIYTVEDGVVEWAGDRNDGYGYSVLINHGNSIRTRYGHMVAGTLKVKIDEKVKKGKALGLMGQTGLSDGVHLHFEVLVGENYTPVNPIGYLHK